MFAESELIIAY